MIGNELDRTISVNYEFELFFNILLLFLLLLYCFPILKNEEKFEHK